MLAEDRFDLLMKSLSVELARSRSGILRHRPGRYEQRCENRGKRRDQRSGINPEIRSHRRAPKRGRDLRPKSCARVKTVAASEAEHCLEGPLYHELVAILFHITGNFVPFCNIGEPFSGIKPIAGINSAAAA